MKTYIEKLALKKYPDSKELMQIYISADNDLKREGFISGYKLAIQDCIIAAKANAVKMDSSKATVISAIKQLKENI